MLPISFNKFLMSFLISFCHLRFPLCHSRENGNLSFFSYPSPLDSRFRGNDRGGVSFTFFAILLTVIIRETNLRLFRFFSQWKLNKFIFYFFSVYYIRNTILFWSLHFVFFFLNSTLNATRYSLTTTY